MINISLESNCNLLLFLSHLSIISILYLVNIGYKFLLAGKLSHKNWNIWCKKFFQKKLQYHKLKKNLEPRQQRMSSKVYKSQLPWHNLVSQRL